MSEPLSNSSGPRLKPAAWILIFLVVIGLLALGVWRARGVLFPAGPGDAKPLSKADIGSNQVEAPDAAGITTV